MERLNELALCVVISIAIATIYGVIFSLEYPLVIIDTPLVSLLSVAGLITYLFLRTAFQLLRRQFKQRQ
jgi:hypothetical protein